MKKIFIAAALIASAALSTNVFAQTKNEGASAAGPAVLVQNSQEVELYHGPLANGTLRDRTIVPPDATPVGSLRDIKRPFAQERIIDQQPHGSTVIMSGDELQHATGNNAFSPFQKPKAHNNKDSRKIAPKERLEPAQMPEPSL